MTSFIGQLWGRHRARASLTEILSGVWLMDAEAVTSLLDELVAGARVFASMADVRDALALSEDREEEARAEPYVVRDGVAHLRLAGPVMKSVPCMMRALGGEATSTVETIAALRKARDDADVKSALLDIDSPGGTVAGTAQLADAVREFAAVKPIHAHADDLMGSAAYWIGAQATRLTASKTAEVGSIGVYTSVADVSKAFTDQGITVHRIASGEEKGIGLRGAPVTEAHLKLLREEVSRTADLFIDAVAEGRGMAREDVAKLATGRTWRGVDAVGIGLIDAVESAEQAHASLITQGPAPSAPISNPAPSAGASKEGPIMSTETKAAADPAVEQPETTVAELKEQLASERKARLLAEAKAEIAAEAQSAARARQVSAVLDRHQARGAFDPANREKMTRLAEAFDDVAELDAHLAQIDTHDVRDAKGKTSDGKPKADALTGELAEGARRFGLTAEDIQTGDRVARISFSRNEMEFEDGSRRELVKATAVRRSAHAGNLAVLEGGA